MKVKELRIWPEFRTIEQIRNWRYRQFDQSSYLPMTMITYLRLSEAGHSEFNFANSFNESVSRTVTQRGVTYTLDTNLLICPYTTYPINGKCYLNPVSNSIGAFIPIHNATSGSLSWLFTAKYSTLMNQTYFDTLDVKF